MMNPWRKYKQWANSSNTLKGWRYLYGILQHAESPLYFQIYAYSMAALFN